jgi:hypothetical protein
MTLRESVTEYVRACFTGIWIESCEHEDALAEIAGMCHEQDWQLAHWDIDAGLQVSGQAESAEELEKDPLAAVRSISGLAQPDGTALLVLRNFHRFLGSPEIVQALIRQITLGKQHRCFVIILAPVVDLPKELEKLFVVVEHDLPTREQLQEIAAGVATEEGDLPAGDELAQVLNAAAGLTRYEAEGASSLSLVRDGSIRPKAVWGIKSQQLKKSGLVTLHQGNERFDQLGGLESLKAFCTRAMRCPHQQDPLRRPRGVLLLGVPGTGKSAIAKALGNEVARPTLTLDIGKLMGSLVGQSEANIRQALKIIDAMQPAVVMIDEVEKALAGAASGGQTDSGVSARLFGTFLTWLNDHESDVFVVCTANRVDILPPEFSRAERFDAVFFLDLPNRQQRGRVWEIYLELFGLDADQTMPQDDGWTGAEIRACCRLAVLLDVPLVEAAENVVPVSVTAAESVEKLRKWATGRCLSASQPGIYQQAQTRSRRRSVSPRPSDN